MKKIRIEIQTALIAVLMILAVGVSGYYFLRSLTRLVDVVHSQAQTDPVLIEIRNISSDLPEVENKARLYILSGQSEHLMDYYHMNDSIVEKIQMVDHLADGSNFPSDLIDSIRTLVLQRLIIWNQILEIHISASDEAFKMPQIVKREHKLPEDTLKSETPRKRFLANLFRKKAPEPEKIEPESDSFEELQKELNDLQRKIHENASLIRNREAELVKSNQEVTSRLYNLIWQIEEIQKKRLEDTTQEARELIIMARKRMVFFAIFMVASIILLITMVLRFIKRNREWQAVLIRSKKQADELARAKERFIANVSHEMRTPVNVVYGVTEQILQRQLDDRLREDLTAVRNSARHLLNLVNDTLDLAKINANLLSISISDFSPDAVFREALEVAKPLASGKNIELRYKLNEELPSSLKGDALRLKQMVLNLLSNAIKFTDQGYVQLDADCHEDHGKFILEVTVTDTGSGIAEEDLLRVFDEFMQSESSTKIRHQGSGLGLAIVKKLAELQDGKVSIKSQPGQGTSVTFTVSCLKGDTESIADKKETTSVELKVADNLNILIVDDEPYNIHLLRLILNKWGISYTEAHDGQQAVDLAGKYDFDLILMDIRMPVMDGFTAAEKILETKPDSIIIALTATADNHQVYKIHKSGMKAFLRKPFEESELAKTIGQYSDSFKTNGGKLTETSDKLITPDIDLNELYRISDNNKSFYLELIQIFVNSTERGLKKMGEALSDGNYRLLADLAHKMASPVKHIQARHLYSKLKELESLDYSQPDKEKIFILFSEIENELRTINTFLKDVYEKEKLQTTTGYPDNN